MKKKVAWVSISAFACLFLVAGIGEVIARSVPDIFAGKVLVLKRRPPSYFRTQGKFVGFLRRHSTKVVHENVGKTWEFETMAFFRRPLGDYEVEMMFYDVENGRDKHRRRFVNSYTQYTQDRNTRSLSGKTQLVRPYFDAHKRYMIVAQSHGKELAKGEFSTRGTSQAAIDQQKRYEKMQKDMEKSMKDLEKKAREQERQQKQRDKKAAADLF